jgi:hypothetical protein
MSDAKTNTEQNANNTANGAFNSSFNNAVNAATSATTNMMNAWMKAPMDAMKAMTEGGDPLKATSEATAKMMESVTAPLKDAALSERTQKALRREVELAGKMMNWASTTSADQIKVVTEDARSMQTLGEEGLQIMKDGVRSATRSALDASAQMAAARDQATRINEYGAKVARTQMDMIGKAMETGRNETAKLVELSMNATKARTEDLVAMQAELSALPFKMAEANLKSTKTAETAPKA